MTLDRGSLIWATRGLTWGFRFLRDGGYSDPLPVYEAAFAGVGAQREVRQRVGDRLVLRFPDPNGRRDSAGRAISHEFVVLPPAAQELEGADAIRAVWDAVAEEYDRIWAQPNPDL